MPDSMVYTDCYKSYDVLDVSEFTHHHINHSQIFADLTALRTFGIRQSVFYEKYNGIERKSFLLFLKECEFRFNFGTPKEQLKILRIWCDI